MHWLRKYWNYRNSANTWALVLKFCRNVVLMSYCFLQNFSTRAQVFAELQQFQYFLDGSYSLLPLYYEMLWEAIQMRWYFPVHINFIPFTKNVDMPPCLSAHGHTAKCFSPTRLASLFAMRFLDSARNGEPEMNNTWSFTDIQRTG